MFSLHFIFPPPARLKVLGDKTMKAGPARFQPRSNSTPASSLLWRGQTGSRSSASIGWMPSKNRTTIQVSHEHAGLSDKAVNDILFVMCLWELWPRSGVPVWKSVDRVSRVSRQLLCCSQEHWEDRVSPASGTCERPACFDLMLSRGVVWISFNMFVLLWTES